MRDARAADWMRRLRSGQWQGQVQLSRFAVDGVPSIGSLEIPIQSPLTVISGANGAGKTTLLRAMWAALDPDNAASTIIADKKLSGGSALVEMSVDGERLMAEARFSADGPEPVSTPAVVVHHIDSAASTPLHQKAFGEFRFRGQRLTSDSVLDSRLTFGGGVGRADWFEGRRVVDNLGIAAA